MKYTGTTPLVGVGVLVGAALALAGCGGGAGHSASASTAPTDAAPGAVTTTVPPTATTVPSNVTTVPSATTVPAPTTAVAPPSSGAPPTSAPAPAGPSSVTGAGPVLIVTSAGGSVNYDGTKPSTIGYSGDATNIVNDLTWSAWGPTGAVGHGLWGYDNCQPTCAQGHVTEVPATIDLGGAAGGHFTTMTETAGTLDRHYTYPGDWATSAR